MHCRGKNMSNLDLKFLINKVRDTLKEKNIPLLVENYDGQWLNCMMLSESGEPLTKIRLVQQIWGQFKKMGKQRLIEDIIQMSRVYVGDLDLIAINGIPVGNSTFNSICVHKYPNTALSVQSSTGLDTCFKLLVSPRDEELWKEMSENTVDLTQSTTNPLDYRIMKKVLCYFYQLTCLKT